MDGVVGNRLFCLSHQVTVGFSVSSCNHDRSAMTDELIPLPPYYLHFISNINIFLKRDF